MWVVKRVGSQFILRLLWNITRKYIVSITFVSANTEDRLDRYSQLNEEYNVTFHPKFQLAHVKNCLKMYIVQRVICLNIKQKQFPVW